MNTTALLTDHWNITSPAWLVALAVLIAYFVVFRKTSASRVALLLLGLAAFVFVFVSPIGVLADGYLFSAHVVQHLVLLLVTPLCLVLSLPPRRGAVHAGGDANPDEPDPLPSRLDTFLSWRGLPLVGWFGGLGAMWFWHVPSLCSASTQSYGLGLLRDSTFLLAGLIFWWPIFANEARHRLPAPVAVVYLFSACLGCTLLGIYITFTTISVCPAFANPIDRLGIVTGLYDLGLTPSVDQHLGGLLMWLPPCMLYIAAILAVLSRWYRGDLNPVPVPLPVATPGTDRYPKGIEA